MNWIVYLGDDNRYHFTQEKHKETIAKNPSEWRVNVTQLANPDGSAVDATDAEELSRAELEGRRQIVDFFAFLREKPGFEKSYILEIAPQIGVRETRRIVGDYQLTERDVLECASFDDTIGVNAWPIEAHVKAVFFSSASCSFGVGLRLRLKASTKPVPVH